MQLTELRATLKRLLDEDGVYRVDSVLDNSLNDGYQLASAISQGCERTVSFTYRVDTGGYCVYLPKDFFLPVGVYADGSRMEPVRVADLDFIVASWLDATASSLLPPTFYWTLGALGPTPSLWLYPRPVADTRIRLTYASIPDRLTNDAHVPKIPTEYHYVMVQYAYAWELLKERGPLLANKAYREFVKFMAQVNELQTIVYRRAPDRDWQTPPWDTEAVRRKLFKVEPVKPQQPQQQDLADLNL
jgi:hypothetical protein